MNTEKSLLTLDDKEAIAYALYDAGFQPETSTDVGDCLIRGYNHTGSYFEHQLVCDEDGKVIPWELVKAVQLRMRTEEEAFNIERGLPIYVIRDAQVFRFKGEFFFVEFVNETMFALLGHNTTKRMFTGPGIHGFFGTVADWNEAIEDGNVFVKDGSDKEPEVWG